MRGTEDDLLWNSTEENGNALNDKMATATLIDKRVRM